MKRLILVTAAIIAAGAGWVTLAPGAHAQTPTAQSGSQAPVPGRGLGPPAATNLFLVTGTPKRK